MHLFIKLFILFVTATGSFQSCQQTCKSIPNSFKSYSEAKKVIENTKFQYTDHIDTPESSWISSASYYSCDGETGFFEMITNKGKSYLFKGMPLDVWEGFKSAKSNGTYYNTHIRDNYQLKTGQ